METPLAQISPDLSTPGCTLIPTGRLHLNSNTGPRMLRLALALGTALLLAACSGSDSTAPPDVPASHTVNRDGQWHAPGLNQPQGVCTECHGADLRGGTAGQPSCYSCHGKKWN